jgi:hypothetical protein
VIAGPDFQVEAQSRSRSGRFGLFEIQDSRNSYEVALCSLGDERSHV